jgi:hypothetical protein
LTNRVREDVRPLFQRKILEEDEILAAIFLRGTVKKAMLKYDQEQGSFFNYLLRPLRRDIHRIIIAEQVGVTSSNVEAYLQVRSELINKHLDASPVSIAQAIRRGGKILTDATALRIETKLQTAASLDR